MREGTRRVWVGSHTIRTVQEILSKFEQARRLTRPRPTEDEQGPAVLVEDLANRRTRHNWLGSAIRHLDDRVQRLLHEIGLVFKAKFQPCHFVWRLVKHA